MKSYFIPFITFLLILSGAQSLSAQSYISMGGFFAQPYGSSAFDKYKGGGGFSSEVISKEIFPRFIFNFQYGAQGDFLFNGGKNFDAQFPFNDYKIQVSNQSLGLATFARITTVKAGIRFYGDFLVGSRLFYSTLTTFNDNDWEYEEDDTDWLTGKLTGYFGVSGGIQIRVAPNFYLDGKVTQTFGSSVRFVDLSTLNYSNGFLDYETAQARNSDMIQVRIGATFQMGEEDQMNQSRKKKQKRQKTQKKPRQQTPTDRPGPEPLPKS